MTPVRIIFVIYPTCAVILSSILKVLFRDRKWSNPLILSLIYVTSNLGIYYYTEGIQSRGRIFGINSTEVFYDLSLQEWIHILIVPNVFTFLYIILAYLSVSLVSYLQQIRKKHIAL